jgi:hypothetical protein
VAPRSQEECPGHSRGHCSTQCGDQRTVTKQTTHSSALYLLDDNRKDRITEQKRTTMRTEKTLPFVSKFIKKVMKYFKLKNTSLLCYYSRKHQYICLSSNPSVIVSLLRLWIKDLSFHYFNIAQIKIPKSISRKKEYIIIIENSSVTIPMFVNSLILFNKKGHNKIHERIRVSKAAM